MTEERTQIAQPAGTIWFTFWWGYKKVTVPVPPMFEERPRG